MIISWDMVKIISDLRKCHRAINDPYETGFVQWPCKQDLYKVKFELDEMLANSPTFADEDEWVKTQAEEREKKRVWRTLNEPRG